MNRKRTFWHTAPALLLWCGLGFGGAALCAAQPAATSYQGELRKDGAPYNGGASFKFAIVGNGGTVTLWSNDGSSNGGGEPNTAVNVAVVRGLFSVCLGCTPMVPLNASEINQSTDVALRVWVDTGTGFERLSDQPLASSPFSLASNTANGAPGDFLAPNGSIHASGALSSGNTINICGGSLPTDPRYVSSDMALDFCVSDPNASNTCTLIGHGDRALRLDKGGTNADRVNVIGGHANNYVTSGVDSATIAGGGTPSFPNRVTSSFGTVGGGYGNTASGEPATVGGGVGNTAERYSTVGGGSDNIAKTNASTVAGGSVNTASGAQATVGGGVGNTASGDSATVAGGADNIASFGAATVSGGTGNIASGDRSTVPGGLSNEASGNFSFAAGRQAQATYDGTFVWADSTPANFTSTGTDQFLIRATGGVGIGTDSPHQRLHVHDGAIFVTATNDNIPGLGGPMMLLGGGALTPSPNGQWGIEYAPATANTDAGLNFWRPYPNVNWGNYFLFLDNNGNVGIGTPTPTHLLEVNGSACAAAWNICSDSRFKENVAPITDALDKVRQLQGVSFDWRRDEFPERRFSDARQIGFIAQDVQPVVPEVVVQGSDGYLSIDYGRLTPLLVESVKEQQHSLESLKTDNAALRADNAALRAELAEIRQALSQHGMLTSTR